MSVTERPRVTAPAFVPRRWLENGHAMTIFAWARARDFPALPPRDARLVRVSPDTEVLAHCYWQTDRSRSPTLVALHGLEGSSDAHYMRGVADKAWRRGWNAVLLNQRNCGGTEHLTPGLYHSGLTDDPKVVIRSLAATDGLRQFGVVGYSLGGNLAMKIACELADAPDLSVRAVVAVSPTIDLDRCVHSLERRVNLAYEWNFVRHLKARMRRKAALWPGAFDLRPLNGIRTIRAFDEIYTAPYHGFAGATDYYHRASALRVVDRIRIPTLVISSADDPFVPPAQFDDPALAGNTLIVRRIERHGGHCGFVSAPGAGDDGYWAEAGAVEFLASALQG